MSDTDTTTPDPQAQEAPEITPIPMVEFIENALTSARNARRNSEQTLMIVMDLLLRAHVEHSLPEVDESTATAEEIQKLVGDVISGRNKSLGNDLRGILEIAVFSTDEAAATVNKLAAELLVKPIGSKDSTDWLTEEDRTALGKLLLFDDKIFPDPQLINDIEPATSTEEEA